MKRLILAAAIMAAIPAFAQTTSESTGMANATSNPVVSNGSSTSSSGANVNGVIAASNPNNAASQNITFNSTAPEMSRAEQILNGHTVEEVHYSGTQTIKNVPSIAMSGPASGPCTGISGSVAIAAAGWGVGANGANVESSCVLRENIRVMGMAYQGVGDPQMKGEIGVMLMDNLRGLNELSQDIIVAKRKDRK